MSFGKLVVICASGEIANLVQPDVDALLIEESGQPEKIAEAVGKLLDDPESAARLSENACKQVRAHDWPTSAKAHVQCYHRSLELA